MPNLIEVQKSSYDHFLQIGVTAEGRQDVGLQEVFKSVFPIKDFSERAELQFVKYELEEPKYDVEECQQRGMTFAAPLKVTLAPGGVGRRGGDRRPLDPRPVWHRRGDLPDTRAPRRLKLPKTTSSGCESGGAARRRSRRWDGSRRITTCRTAWFRERGCPKCSVASGSSRRGRDFALATCFMPATAISHPLICYDERIPGQADRAVDVAGEILTYCIEAGGSITGEHGVGADKREDMGKMFTDDDLDAMQRLRDAFDPKRLCNPRQSVPDAPAVWRGPGPYREHPVETAGVAERF